MKHPLIFAAAAILLVSSAAVAQTAARAPGWITAANKPCKIWNPEPQSHESVAWSGGCKNGFASGKGVLRWTENGKPDVEFDGEYANGKRNGPGVMIMPDGHKVPGQWADDEPITGNANAI